MCPKLNSFENCLNEVVKRWFGEKNTRPFIRYAIAKIEQNWENKNIFIIEAPTGYGKSTISSTISMYSLNEELKSIVAFPLRSLLEDQFIKFQKLFGDKTGKRYMHNPQSRYLIRPVTLTTVDTLALTFFGIPPEDIDKVVRYWSGTSSGSLGHYLFSWASVALSNIILDEVHLMADSTKSLNFLSVLVSAASDNDQKIIMMSATIPNALEQRLREIIENSGIGYEFIKFKPEHDKEFVEDRKKKRYAINLQALTKESKFRVIENWIEDESKKFSRITVVFNTVKDAVEFYRTVKNKFREFETLLLHSRFNERDRELKAKKLKELKNSERFIIVTTQVIEAGVDISSNLFITELAPANSLIQRLGRFLRYDEREGSVYIWYEVDDSGCLLNKNGRYKVYDWVLSNKTLEGLKELGEFNVHLAEGYGNLLDIYNEEDFQIDRECVSKLKRILMNFEQGPIKAVESFLELEGSFIRDGLMIPVICHELIDECRNKDGKLILKEISRLSIPVAFEIVRRANPSKVIMLKKDRENEDEVVEIVDFKAIPEWVMNSPQTFLRCMIRNSITAVVIDATYNDENGLVIGDD